MSIYSDDVASIRALVEEIRSATANTRLIGAEIAAERVEFAREQAESEEKRARAARRGDLGSDWKAVQARIDARRTTLTAVMSGEDKSPEAGRLLDQSAIQAGGTRPAVQRSRHRARSG